MLAISVSSFDISNAQQGRRGKGRQTRPDRIDKAPKVGETAPLFILSSQDGESKTSLAYFEGKKPVVLFLGSYT